MDNRKGIFIGFNKSEEKLYVWLREEAEINKRSINAEIKFKLGELKLSGERVTIKYKISPNEYVGDTGGECD